jgi:hypothetical protein
MMVPCKCGSMGAAMFFEWKNEELDNFKPRWSGVAGVALAIVVLAAALAYAF